MALGDGNHLLESRERGIEYGTADTRHCCYFPRQSCYGKKTQSTPTPFPCCFTNFVSFCIVLHAFCPSSILFASTLFRIWYIEICICVKNRVNISCEGAVRVDLHDFLIFFFILLRLFNSSANSFPSRSHSVPLHFPIILGGLTLTLSMPSHQLPPIARTSEEEFFRLNNIFLLGLFETSYDNKDIFVLITC